MSTSFGHLKRAMHVLAVRDYSHLGLSVSQLVALKTIHHLQPVTSKDLAKYMQVTPGAASQLLDALVDADCIVRTLNETDRRVSYLTVSRKGKQKLQEFQKTHVQMLLKACKDVSDEDLEAYIRVQQAMITWLEAQN
jgi:DNA-binding MarR family transcriptional regulator